MLETRVRGGRKNKGRGAKLLDTTQPLKFRRIDDFNLERTDLNVTVNCVANHLPHWGYYLLEMTEPFSHTFFDIEVETVDPIAEVSLVKILSVDGRRFTYELRGKLTDDSIAYMKSLMDAAVFSDLVIERTGEGEWESRESRTRLKWHS